MWGTSNPLVASISNGQGSSLVSVEGNMSSSQPVNISAALENIQAPEAQLTVNP